MPSNFIAVKNKPKGISDVMSFKHFLTGWTHSDFDIYQETFSQYGGGVNTHPDMIRFFMRNSGMKFDFWHYCNKGKVTAAYFITDGKVPGLNVWRDYPVSYDEIMFPVAPGQKIFLPERTNRLSFRHQRHIVNSFYSAGTRHKVCLVKDCFSARTEKKRNSELKRFFAMGGECYKLRELPPDEIAQLYVHLFKLRFGNSVRCYAISDIKKILCALQHMVFGNVLFFNGLPCAIDLVLMACSDRFIYFDVPNGGLDPQFSALSPGSLLMWANICDARSWCLSQNKEMIFSIGMYEKNWDYKLRWAVPYGTGKVFCL